MANRNNFTHMKYKLRDVIPRHNSLKDKIKFKSKINKCKIACTQKIQTKSQIIRVKKLKQSNFNMYNENEIVIKNEKKIQFLISKGCKIAWNLLKRVSNHDRQTSLDATYKDNSDR